MSTTTEPRPPRRRFNLHPGENHDFGHERVYEQGKITDHRCRCGLLESEWEQIHPSPKAPRPLTVDQARTQDLERRGFHNAEVRSDGTRALVECDVTDLDRLLSGGRKRHLAMGND